MADNPAGLTSGVVPNLVSPESITLTTDQKALVRDIVARYDTNNLSDKDREEIRASLKEADIGPSRALFQELQKAGIAPPAPESHRDRPNGGPRPDGPPPPPRERPPATAKDDEQAVIEKFLGDVLGRYDVENLTPEEVDKLKEALNARANGDGPIVDLIG